LPTPTQVGTGKRTGTGTSAAAVAAKDADTNRKLAFETRGEISQEKRELAAMLQKGVEL
jgi:hypothetical protein